jgi:hypothetical protein
MMRCLAKDIPAAILVLVSCDGAGLSRASGGVTPQSPRPEIEPGQSSTAAVAAAPDAAPASMKPKGARMWMTVAERRFAITLTDNAAARAWAAQLPLRLHMSELNGNEKHASLPKALPANASRPGTIRSGDLMLYGTDTLVVFYATFDSSYSYTRLGSVDDPADLSDVLGRRDVTVVFSKD